MNVLCEHQTLSMKLSENHLFSIHKWPNSEIKPEQHFVH